MRSRYSFLGHEYRNFSKSSLLHTANEYNLSNISSLEAHLWVYELCYQIQKISGSSCILKGGASTQLYLPLNVQRCTIDIDMSTTLTTDKLHHMLSLITATFNKNNFISSFREYTPRFTDNSLRIPMKTFLFTLPFVYRNGKNGNYADIKMDFVFSETEQELYHLFNGAETIGMKLNYSPICLTPYAAIGSKLLIFAVSSIGLPEYKTESFYKNIYDLYHLLSRFNDIGSFKRISEALPALLQNEYRTKKLSPWGLEDTISDILKKLYYLFTEDLLVSIPRIPGKLLSFEENSLQGTVRSTLSLDSWSVMAMSIFIWINSLKLYMTDGNLGRINVFQEANESYSHYKAQEKFERRKILKDYKKKIFILDNRLMLARSISPIRIIYLYYILDRLKYRFI